MKSDLDCLFDVLGDPEIAREQVRGSRRDDREADIGAGQHVNAALHHPVAAPCEDKLGPVVHRTPNLIRRLPALRHLAPERVIDAMGREDTAKLGEAAAKCLSGVGDDRDFHASSCRRGVLPGSVR